MTHCWRYDGPALQTLTRHSANSGPRLPARGMACSGSGVRDGRIRLGIPADGQGRQRQGLPWSSTWNRRHPDKKEIPILCGLHCPGFCPPKPSWCAVWTWLADTDCLGWSCDVFRKFFLLPFSLQSDLAKFYAGVSTNLQHQCYNVINHVNPLTAKSFNLNFHPLEVASRWRDPQLQVSENYSDLTKWRSTVFKYCWLMSHFIFNMFKRWYLMC